MSSLMRKINIISRCESLYRSDKLNETKLGACHHSYVLAICRHPGMSQEQLSKHLYINKSNVARQLSYLEENGYVSRRSDSSDKRISAVYPTQKMLDVFPEVIKTAKDWSEYIFSDLSEEELEAFSKTLEKVSQRAQSYFSIKDGKEE
ncbi:MAG: MarR family winged helix-turn-helix transcriptional regulator [Eubacteriales bacterium]